MSESSQNPQAQSLELGTYEILQNRLQKQKEDLLQRNHQLNEARKSVFGSIETQLIATDRINTENNCVARDIISLGNTSIFGYNVHFGLRTDIELNDVFSVYHYENQSFKETSLNIIEDEQFITDFKNLYKYYRNTLFARFSKTENYVYMVFQLSENVQDIKVFKWLIQGESLKYMDDRSEHEYKYPPQHQFQWIECTRDMQRYGTHPHISIEDQVFVETVGGDLTIKIEDNTEDGQGIYSEPVEYHDQTLDDGLYRYADIGNLIILEIKPFQEEARYFAFNKKVQEVKKIDSLKDSCVLLPDDQGIIFPTGYYLQTGEYHLFESSLPEVKFLKRTASPNGEDYLFVFYSPTIAKYNLMSYNVIDQEIATPILCSGYTLFENGELCYFQRDTEQTKHHIVQIWQTPFSKEEQVAAEQTDSILFKIGNKDIVSAMAEIQALVTLLNKEDNYNGLYEDIAKASKDVLDSYYWLSEKDTYELNVPLTQITETANSAIDEFEKVRQLKKQASDSLKEIQKKSETLSNTIKSTSFKEIEQFVHVLDQLRQLRGELISLREIRYIDEETLNEIEESLEVYTQKISEKTVQFLLDDKALQPYETKVEEKEKKLKTLEKQLEVKELYQEIQEIGSELELLIDIVSNLQIEDTAHSTAIIDKISLIFSRLNQLKSAVKNKQDSLGATEAKADFKAQITLLDQSLVSYFDIADTLEKLEEYQNKISIQLEDLESKFAEYDEFLPKITEKREEIYTAFESKKSLIEEKKNKRILSLLQSADRILNGIGKKAQSFDTETDINGYFASDLMVHKVRDISDELQELGDSGNAEELITKLKVSQQEAVRQLKDKKELFVEGENIIKFGKHRFGVNTQNFSVSILPQEDRLLAHISGTDFYQEVEDQTLYQNPKIWQQDIVSENNQIYRSAYLAYTFAQNIGIRTLQKWNAEERKKALQKYSQERLTEGYIKGVHDEDATQILEVFLDKKIHLGMLQYPSKVRAMAQFFWESLNEETQEKLKTLIQASGEVNRIFPDNTQHQFVIQETMRGMQSIFEYHSLFDSKAIESASHYLYAELNMDNDFEISFEAQQLSDTFLKYIKEKEADIPFRNLQESDKELASKFQIGRQWLQAFISEENQVQSTHYIDEALCILFFNSAQRMLRKALSPVTEISGMLGQHPTIDEGVYVFDYHRFVKELENYTTETQTEFKQYREALHEQTESLKNQLNIDKMQADVLSSFVRNKLIDQVYLPLIGDNLAKQIGSVGEGSRTDRMGMLLLISPPGYGKTTLMEYVASRLGLAFMKINGPAIGHEVTSIDPAAATNSAAKEELKKLNLALEMGNNVMLYIDDIQHCHPEFLQKFISLADGTRTIEGVYNEKPKTYSLRSKKFCVIMAGNPYTEQGTRFQVPDMLANRSDIYNLGDIIGDSAQLFKQSLIENAITSNTVLNQLRNKSTDDLYMLMNYLENEGAELQWKGKYSAQEQQDFISVMKKAIEVRDTVMLVNAQYIQSAAMEDAYRTEPPFKLQGSYRDMNKLVAKIVPIMNEKELHQLLLSHYESESQTLTSQAEANLLKYKELTHQLSQEEQARWEAIKAQFQKNNKLAGFANQNEMAVLLAQLQEFTEGLQGIQNAISKKKE